MEELQSIKALILNLAERDFSNNNETLSMNKLCKISKKGREFWKEQVSLGNIKAVVKRTIRKGKMFENYSFQMRDFIEWQKNFATERSEIVYRQSSDDRIKELIKKVKEEPS